MTVSSDLNRKDYSGDGVTTAFSFPYYFLADSDLVVTTLVVATGVETILVLNTGYTVAGAGSPSGGTVTLAAPLATGTNLTILRDPAVVQQADFVANDPLPTETLEKGFDLLTMIVQTLVEKFKRTLLLPVTSTLTNLVITPAASKFLRWNADATALENVDITGLGSVGIPVSIIQGGTGQSAKTTQNEMDAATANKFVTADLLWNTKLRGGWRNIVGANGGLEVWQRHAGGSASIAVPASTTVYTADRWYLATGANQASVVSQQAGLIDGSRYCARVQRNAGQTGIGGMTFGFPLETNEVARMRGKNVSCRLVVRAGANWSPTNGTINVRFYTGTGAEAKRGGGFTNEVQHLNGTVSVNLTAGGAAVLIASGSGAVTVPANATQGELQLTWTPTGTAGADDWFEIDDVDLRAGEPVIDQFERRPFEDELRACMRHFQKSFDYSVAPAQNAGANGSVVWRTTATGAVVTDSPERQLTVPMRNFPTGISYNPSAANAEARNTTDAADCSATAVNVGGLNFGSTVRIQTTANVGAAVNELIRCHYTLDGGI